jgi:hypothetical protein
MVDEDEHDDFGEGCCEEYTPPIHRFFGKMGELFECGKWIYRRSACFIRLILAFGLTINYKSLNMDYLFFVICITYLIVKKLKWKKVKLQKAKSCGKTKSMDYK